MVAKRLQNDVFQGFFVFRVPQDAIDIDSLHRTQESLHEIIAREARGFGALGVQCMTRHRCVASFAVRQKNWADVLIGALVKPGIEKPASLLNFLTRGSHFQIKAISGSSFKLLVPRVASRLIPMEAEVAWPHAILA